MRLCSNSTFIDLISICHMNVHNLQASSNKTEGQSNCLLLSVNEYCSVYADEWNYLMIEKIVQKYKLNIV